MRFHRSLWISALSLGALVIPASAGTSTTTTPTPTLFSRTFYFPAIGIASSETARISVVNIAQTSHKGTKASCNGSISFTDSTGAPAGKTTAITDLGTGQITHGDLAGSGARAEYQGSVTVTINTSSPSPCSLLLTLETFDTTSGVTHAVVTAAVPAEPALGEGR